MWQTGSPVSLQPVVSWQGEQLIGSLAFQHGESHVIELEETWAKSNCAMTPRCSASRACETSRLEKDDTSVTPKTTNTKRTEGGWKATRNRRQNGWRQFFLRDNLLSNWLFHPNIVPTIRCPYLDSRIAFCALCQWPFPAHRSALLIFPMFSNALGSFLVAMSPVGAAWRKVYLHPASPRATESPRELH